MGNLKFDKQYWEKRYTEGATQWDIGHISEPLKAYFDQLTNKDLKILIPGCGNAYEGSYLHQNGFKQVYLADIAPTPLADFAKKHPDFPKEHLLEIDYFTINESYDLIIEQTFFCALHPSEREKYVQKTASLLKPGGILIGLLFASTFEKDGPPFGGTLKEYHALFGKYFEIEVMEPAYNSIQPRSGNELFIKLRKFMA